MLYKVNITPGFYLGLCFLVLVVPLPWVAAWSAAAAVHELMHIIAVKILGGQILCFSLGMTGAQIEADNLSSSGRILAGLAGPAGGLMLLPLIHVFPRLTLCGLFQSFYNLLPLYPLDGGRVLRCFLQSICSRRFAVIIENVAALLTLLLLTGLALYLGYCWSFREIPLLFSAILWINVLKSKIPCKRTHQGVQ